METQCPACHSVDVVDGRLLGQTDGGFGFVFRPRGLRLLAWFGTDVSVADGFNACLECGMLWSAIDKRRLAHVIARKGGKPLKRRLVDRILVASENAH